ncbi:MAG: tetratricopeptide repeat protein [Weeksellaceae bacterium]|nr:tetratricopeptide repeat protein [Weeksellaceae bacterium]
MSDKKVDNAILDSTYRQISYDTLSLRKFLSLSREHGNSTAEIFFLNKFGIFYRDKSRYKLAHQHHRTALALAVKNKNREQTIITINLIGVVYRRQDDIIPAISSHQNALKLAEEVENPNETVLRNIAISCNSLGNVYLTMNQLDDAMQNFQRSLEIEKKINNRLGLAINYQNIGGIYEKKNNLEMALFNYRQSLFYNRKINSELGKLICNNSIGGIYLKQGKIKEAEKYISPTISQAEKIQDAFYTSMSYINTGWLYLLQGKPEAEITIRKGLSIAEDKGFTSSKIEAYELLSRLFERGNKMDSAFAYYKKFAAEKELLNNESTFRSISELKNKYTLERRKNEINVLKQQQDQLALRLSSNKLLSSIAVILLVFLGTIYYFYMHQKALRQEKKLLLMEHEILNLQMNPHFIFNALNSIKAYIVKNDTQNSVYYLNKFSKIFRNILTGIHHKETNLKEELENVENYLSIENMRFGGAVQYAIKIDDELNAENIRIPSFLLQVFAENAVWHGLAPKGGEKKLEITISKLQENKICIEIKDNGIGRKKAKKISEKTFNKKESLGLEISKRRLERLYAKEYSLKIIDMENDAGKATGTLVHLEIPI